LRSSADIGSMSFLNPISHSIPQTFYKTLPFFNRSASNQFNTYDEPANMPTAEGRPQTLYDKVFQDHIVDERLDGTILLYIGNHDSEYYRRFKADFI